MPASLDALSPTLAQARDALRAGNALLCFDIVERAAQRGLQAPELEYLGILALAHCGSTQQALERYHRAQRSAVEIDQDWLALEGRLFKDLAMQGGAATHFMYARAAHSYWQAFQKTGGYFSAVNAATMFMLAGDAARAEPIARDVLALTEAAGAQGELERYNLQVSHAEAALLLGDLERCRKTLRAADSLARDHRSARARTMRQLRLICQQRRLDKSIPGLLTIPPQVCVFRDDDIDIGESNAALHAAVEQLSLPAFALRGALVHIGVQAPVDLCVVECLIARGAQVSVVIAGTRDQTLANWQQVYGGTWAMRLARGLDQAQEVSATPGFLASEPLWMRRAVAAKVLGLSCLLPEPIRTDWLGFSLTAAQALPGFSLVALSASQLRETERRLLDPLCPLSEESRASGVRERRMCALLVAEFSGLEAVVEAELPRYWSRVLALLAPALGAAGNKLLDRRTWGAALRLVTTDASSAAELALALQAIVAALDPEHSGLGKLELRQLLHFGPAYFGDDPVASGTTCYGSQVTLAQTAVGDVPAGVVLATEDFAARQVVEADESCRTTYVGQMPRADLAPRLRLFALQRA